MREFEQNLSIQNGGKKSGHLRWIIEVTQSLFVVKAIEE